MNEDVFKVFRSANREHLHFLWEKAKNKDFDDLEDEDRRLAEAMRLHEDEFFNQFEFSDILSDREFDPDSESDPFLHIGFHAIVENQLAARDPLEVFQFYNAMRNRKCSHHETVHLIGAILVRPLFDTMKYQVPFDNDRYVALLKKYKSRKPDKVWAALDSADED